MFFLPRTRGVPRPIRLPDFHSSPEIILAYWISLFARSPFAIFSISSLEILPRNIYFLPVKIRSSSFALKSQSFWMPQSEVFPSLSVTPGRNPVSTIHANSKLSARDSSFDEISVTGSVKTSILNFSASSDLTPSISIR